MKTNLLKMKQLGSDEWRFSAVINGKQEEVSQQDYDRATTLLKAPEVQEVVYISPGCFTIMY